MCYLADARPFEETWLNRLEMANELLVLLAIYCLYGFAGVVTDPEQNYMFSGYLVYVIYASLVLNFIVAVWVTVTAICRERQLKAAYARKLEIIEVQKLWADRLKSDPEFIRDRDFDSIEVS